MNKHYLSLKGVLASFMLFLALTAPSVRAYVISFSSSDFTNTPRFSNVTTYNFHIDIPGALTPGLVVSNPVINTIEYNVRGSLETGTPSGFSGFVFQVSHLVTGVRDPITNALIPPTSIPGSLFYALNGDPVLGQTLSFQVSNTADLSDGLQINELTDMGSGVVFRLNGRETGEDGRPGRYHPTIIEIKSDGTGLLQNANNSGGINPATNEEVDVDFGEEYITDFTFDASRTTLAINTIVPEPSSTALLGGTCLAMLLRRRR